jgi:hypothetical protein
MRRKTQVAMLATIALGVFAAPAPAPAQTNGGGNSANAPGQERAQANCTHVWSEIQADLVAKGGPKSELATGPTNCDHFWQSQGVIGNG